MDVVAHAAWTNVLYEAARRRSTRLAERLTRRDRIVAIVCGFAPDLVAFGPAVVIGLFRNSTLWFYFWDRLYATWGAYLPVMRAVPVTVSSTATAQLIPPYVYQLYDLSHSLVIFTIVFGLVWLVRRRPYLPLLGWALHIIIDIFTHREAFFPTPFLYPLSAFRVSGISWAEPWFVVLNYAALIIVYVLLYGGIWRASYRERRLRRAS